MYIEFNIALNGTHFFATAERSITDSSKAIAFLEVLRAKFPENEGYSISAGQNNQSSFGIDLNGDIAAQINTNLGRRYTKEDGLKLGVRLMYFGLNYPHDFISKVWANDTNIANHLQSKFNGYYDKRGSHGVFAEFFVNLDRDNQNKLLYWIDTNYKG